jgi:hypothetical protein
MREDMQLPCERAASLLSANPSSTLHEVAHSIGTDRHKIQRAIREQYGFCFRELTKRIEAFLWTPTINLTSWVTLE